MPLFGTIGRGEFRAFARENRQLHAEVEQSIQGVASQVADLKADLASHIGAHNEAKQIAAAIEDENERRRLLRKDLEERAVRIIQVIGVVASILALLGVGGAAGQAIAHLAGH